jgi:sterol desaturase/sphingolipid hydroxylase (fatty acid hydroxylase superfamily)
MNTKDDFWLRDHVRNTRGRMFESDFLEFFSKVHPATPFVFWIPVTTSILGYALLHGWTDAVHALPMLPIGFFSWQFLEYFIHKNLFHTFPGPTAHGFHHKYVDDDTRLVMPLTVSLVLASLIAGGLYLLGAPRFTVPFWAGLVYGYLWYDFLHWSTHHRKPLTAWGKKLRDFHMAHHFADPHKNFGLSHMWMDRLMGTAIKRDDK